MTIVETGVSVQQLIGTVQFRRVVQVGSYEPAEALVSLQFGYDSTFSGAEIAAMAEDTLLLAEGVALAKLNLDGLGGSTEEDTVAKVLAATGGTIDTSSSEATWPTPTFVGRDGKDKVTKEFKEWAKSRFQTNPSEFFDNRLDKKFPSSPDIKHKATGTGVWLD